MFTKNIFQKIITMLFIVATLFSSFQAPVVSAQGGYGLKRQVNANSKLTPTLSGGAAWYVATTGSDSNDCATISTPCATINGAIGKAADGDIIEVAAGTYT